MEATEHFPETSRGSEQGWEVWRDGALLPSLSVRSKVTQGRKVYRGDIVYHREKGTTARARGCWSQCTCRQEEESQQEMGGAIKPQGPPTSPARLSLLKLLQPSKAAPPAGGQGLKQTASGGPFTLNRNRWLSCADSFLMTWHKLNLYGKKKLPPSDCPGGNFVEHFLN